MCATKLQQYIEFFVEPEDNELLFTFPPTGVTQLWLRRNTPNFSWAGPRGGGEVTTYNSASLAGDSCLVSATEKTAS